ncbi:MAG: hypothetical protein ABGX16_11505 [Pirellulales bacterium]
MISHGPWSVADAKSKLSEVLNRADDEVQFIKRRECHYVILNSKQYYRLTGETPSLKNLILNGPSLEGLALGRDSSPGREVEL